MSGMSEAEAERSFLEQPVDPDELQSINEEIRELIKSNKAQEEVAEDDKWVNESDMEDN